MTRDELITANLGLVHSCARRFTGKGVEYDDLYEAGCLGLVKAVDRFDPSMGYKLSTYAVPLILGEIRLLFREGGSVSMSRSVRELSVKAAAIVEERLRDSGEHITVSELAEMLGVDVYRAQEALNASRPPLSLSCSDDDPQGCADIPVPSGEDSLTERLSLRQALSELGYEERELIRLRYFGRKTQAETARALNTTQVQISRREKKILTHLRSMLI